MRAVRNNIPRMATLLLGLGLLSAVASLAKVPMITPGGELPKLRGELLSGRGIALPDSARGSAR